MLVGALSPLDCASVGLRPGGEGEQVLWYVFRRGPAVQVFSLRVILVDWGDLGFVLLFVPCTWNWDL